MVAIVLGLILLLFFDGFIAGSDQAIYGNAVRLYKGEMDKATVFNENPAAQALEFVTAGCEWLHLVDLNGAFAGLVAITSPCATVTPGSAIIIGAVVDLPACIHAGMIIMGTKDHDLILERSVRSLNQSDDVAIRHDMAIDTGRHFDISSR